MPKKLLITVICFKLDFGCTKLSHSNKLLYTYDALIFMYLIDPDELLNLKTLSEQLNEISESFRAFRGVAGVSPTALIEVAARCSNFTDSMTEVCDLWHKKCHKWQTPPTWHTVSEILHLIGHDKLSQDLLKVYKIGMILNDTCSYRTMYI